MKKIAKAVILAECVFDLCLKHQGWDPRPSVGWLCEIPKHFCSLDLQSRANNTYEGSLCGLKGIMWLEYPGQGLNSNRHSTNISLFIFYFMWWFFSSTRKESLKTAFFSYKQSHILFTNNTSIYFYLGMEKVLSLCLNG